ncbi:forespore capture DNA-binding protein RefZ [Peribacillus sp. B-H-3]|jgi:AcrR family transcriptional regulator|uniref:forespore capture DNA-binding protein RefZ n=1 Tax=Peribacillus sp. B-H-3 TaxID=3400420 RepID=UPI003B011444
MNRQTRTKQLILDAALYLFHLKGYHATSIRDIAGKAKVNPANIAYYFKNKQGLLEYCFTSYLEEYVKILDINILELERKGPKLCLSGLVLDILEFQKKNFLASSFIYGESSWDSSLNREILSTYFTKERFYFQLILEKGMKEHAFQNVSIPVFILQLKGLLSAPVMHSHYAMEVLYVFPQENYYNSKYGNEIIKFLQSVLFTPDSEIIVYREPQLSTM